MLPRTASLETQGQIVESEVKTDKFTRKIILANLSVLTSDSTVESDSFLTCECAHAQ